MRTLQTPPARMVETNGSIHFGTYTKPFGNTNILDAPLYGISAPRCWRNFRLKEWQHFGIITPQYYFGTVIFDAKFTGVSFFCVIDRLKNVRIEYVKQTACRAAIRVSRGLYDDTCRMDLEGYHLCFENKLSQGFHRLMIDIRPDAQCPAVKGEIILHEDLDQIEPLVQVSPITAYRPFYTHKAAVPVSGTISIGSQDISLKSQECIALIDEQKTYYPYISFWKWATAAGYDNRGRLLAFNLCQNMIADDEDDNENCFWLDGKLSCLKAACFEYDEVTGPWRVETTDGRMKLILSPAGERASKINKAGIIRSEFHQPYGLYNGHVKDDSGIEHPISGFFGLAEYHMMRY